MGASLSEFYRGKKVLLTGHTGFKGGWLATWLKLLGAEVIGLALQPATNPNLFHAANVAEGLTSVFGDVRDLAGVVALFRQHNPDIIIHNAAQALVRRSYREPVETYATNVMGTVHTLEAARQITSVRAVVVVTSDKCYDNRGSPQAHREKDAMGGEDPYSSSKGAAELVIAAYRQSFFNRKETPALASARAGNVIGGGDWSEDRLIPDVVRAISSSQPVVIRNPDHIRPWQHVLEPLRGYLLLGQRLWEHGESYAQGWNFGPHQEDATTVVDVVRLILAAWGTGELQCRSDSAAPPEARYLQLNCEKSRQQLNWKPELNLNQAIDWTVSWYRSYLEQPARGRAVTESQIEQYMSMTLQ